MERRRGGKKERRRKIAREPEQRLLEIKCSVATTYSMFKFVLLMFVLELKDLIILQLFWTETGNKSKLCPAFALYSTDYVCLCTEGALSFLFSRGHREDNVEWISKAKRQDAELSSSRGDFRFTGQAGSRMHIRQEHYRVMNSHLQYEDKHTLTY